MTADTYIPLVLSAPTHMTVNLNCWRRRSSRPVLFRVLVLPFLYSKDPRDQSAEEKSGGIPHLVHTHTKNTNISITGREISKFDQHEKILQKHPASD